MLHKFISKSVYQFLQTMKRSFIVKNRKRLLVLKNLLDINYLEYERTVSASHNSQPIGICIENNSDSVVHNHKLFGSYNTVRNDIFNGNGDLVSGNVLTRSVYKNVSYLNILQDLQSRPINVTQTRISIQTESGKSATSQFVLSYTNKDIFGNEALRYDSLLIDPLQFNSNIFVSKRPFVVDGFGGVLISEIPAKSKVSINFYTHSEELKPMSAYIDFWVGLLTILTILISTLFFGVINALVVIFALTVFVIKKVVSLFEWSVLNPVKRVFMKKTEVKDDRDRRIYK